MRDSTLIIVGGGIGGAASALRAAQYQIPTVWILGDRSTQKASRAAYVKNIDNMLGVHPGIVQDRLVALLDSDFPDAARRVAATHLHISTVDLIENAKARIRTDFEPYVEFVEERAVDAQQSHGGFQVGLAGGDRRHSPYLILATGVMDRQPVVHRQRGDRDLSGIHWLFPYANEESLLYCIRCEGHLTPGRRVGILGSGEGAAQVALIIRERYGSSVSILTTGEPITWSEKSAGLLDLEEVQVTEGRLVEVHGERRGEELKGFTVESGARIDVDLAFVAMGLHRVYNDLARELGARLEEGEGLLETRHVQVDARGSTSVRNLFAVGDMVQRGDERVMKQIYTAQEYAVRAVDVVDHRRRMSMRSDLHRR